MCLMLQPTFNRPRHALAVRRYRAHTGELRWSRGENLLPIEVNVNDTPAVSDDIVRKEQKVGGKAWRQWIPCTVTLPNASELEVINIVISSGGNTMRFAQDSHNPQNRPNDATEGSTNVTVAIGATGTARFWVTGVTQSQKKNGAVMRIRKNSASGKILAEHPVTVFWFDPYLEISSSASSTSSTHTAEGALRFGLKRGNGIGFTAGAEVIPAGLDPWVPQISDWRFGVVQNCITLSVFGYGDPQIAANQQLAAGEEVSVPDKFLHVYTSPQMLDAVSMPPGVKQTFLWIGLQPEMTGTGQSSFTATNSTGKAFYYGSDAPHNRMDLTMDRQFPVVNNPAKNVTVRYSVQWSGMDDIFLDWCGLVSVKDGNVDPNFQFIPLKQRGWSYSANSKNSGPQPPVIDSSDRDPDTVPVIHLPLIAPSKVPNGFMPDPDSTNIRLP